MRVYGLLLALAATVLIAASVVPDLVIPDTSTIVVDDAVHISPIGWPDLPPDWSVDAEVTEVTDAQQAMDPDTWEVYYWFSTRVVTIPADPSTGVVIVPTDPNPGAGEIHGHPDYVYDGRIRWLFYDANGNLVHMSTEPCWDHGLPPGWRMEWQGQ